MKSIHDYIIHIDGAFHDTIKMNSGVEIYLDKRLNARELANTNGTVIETPAYIENPIQIGTEVIVDSTVLLSQSYKGTEQQSTFIADKQKGWYFVDRSLILMYKDKNTWLCYGKNLFVEPLEVEEESVESSLIILDKKAKYIQGRAKVVFLNDYLKDSDVRIGETLYIKPNKYIEYNLDSKVYWWIRNTDIIASEINENVLN